MTKTQLKADASAKEVLAAVEATRIGWVNRSHCLETRKEAADCIKWCEKTKHWHGPIERRPGECHQL